MKIENARIQAQSSHALTIQHQEQVIRQETLLQNAPETRNAVTESLSPQADFRVSLSTGTRIHKYDRHSAETYTASGVSAGTETEPASEQRVKLMVLLKTMEKMTGKSYAFSEFQFKRDTVTIDPFSASAGVAPSPQGAPETTPAAEPVDNRVRQVETYTETRHYEAEQTGFAASGIIRTQDGRQIAIDVQLNMSREYYEENIAYQVQTSPLTDPLIVNWDGAAADLTTDQYEFDLNSDGMAEQISFVSPGKGGFLAYDRNRDGRINSGTELFGPATGNGFSELAAGDVDSNGWIDENDSVYFDLSVWTKTAEGKDQLIALADTGIGAIYLNAAETPFSVTTGKNEILGQVQRTSVYLNEDGSAGTIQQVDLSTNRAPAIEKNLIHTAA